MMNLQIYRLDSLPIDRALIVLVVSLFAWSAIHAGGIVQPDKSALLLPAAADFDPLPQSGPQPQKSQNLPKQACKGEALYHKYCQKCHGMDGTGAEGKK